MIQRSVPTPTSHRINVHGGIVYLGGLGAPDRDERSMRDQAAQVFERIETLLNSVGSSKDKLLTVTIYISDPALKSDMDEVWKAWLGTDHLPARATIAVGDMGSNILIEAVATAAA